MASLDDVIPGGVPEISPFAPTSRYASTPIAAMSLDGVTVRFVTRRFVPDPGALAVLGTRVVVAGDRGDVLAATIFGDPELFWRLCDGNRIIFPGDLTAELGRRLRITGPQGVPGGPRA